MDCVLRVRGTTCTRTLVHRLRFRCLEVKCVLTSANHERCFWSLVFSGFSLALEDQEICKDFFLIRKTDILAFLGEAKKKQTWLGELQEPKVKTSRNLFYEEALNIH